MATRPKPRRTRKAPVKGRPRGARKAPVTEPSLAPAPTVTTSSPAESPAAITSGEGYGIRLAARILDSVYVTFLGFFSGLFGGIFLAILEATGVIQAGWEDQLKGFDWGLVLASLFAVPLYHWAAEWIAGVSVGKLVCQLRVVQQDGRPCSFRGAFFRNLGYYFDGLFFGLVGYLSMGRSPLKQRFGDAWGKTVVVKASNVPEGSKASGLHLFLAIAIGSAFNMICMVAALVLRAL